MVLRAPRDQSAVGSLRRRLAQRMPRRSQIRPGTPALGGELLLARRLYVLYLIHRLA